MDKKWCEGWVRNFNSGNSQFLSTVGEFTRGATQPFIPPVWDRHLLTARNPPCVTHVHLEFTQIPNDFFPSLSTLIQHSFFFRLNELSTLRRQLPPHLAHPAPHWTSSPLSSGSAAPLL
ncbi:hypothetical protein Sjap_008214 [Stephania japonica]|uniref:Uncharacterized protein n=1 Tax=Stephania japonica TaxID=461633 RepID=A0AAP0PED6_9MAGN